MTSVNVEIIDTQDSISEFDNVNQNVARSLAADNLMLKLATNNGGCEFNMFLTSNTSSTVPKLDPWGVQTRIMSKIEHFKQTDNV